MMYRASHLPLLAVLCLLPVFGLATPPRSRIQLLDNFFNWPVIP